MRLWISRRSEVPVREQLVTQILLAIASKELAPEAKLPSTRALARQLGIHPNTVSAAYRELSTRGWVVLRHGSGVYVSALSERPRLSGDLELDGLINDFMRQARGRGFSLSEIRSRAKRWLELQPPDHFLVIEDDEELRTILVREIENATSFPVRGASQCERLPTGAQPVALYGRSAELPELLPPDVSCIWLQVRSVHDELAKSLEPLPAGWSITVASRWSEFRKRARTMLLAVGFDPEALHFVDARNPGWERGLTREDFLITDSVTQSSLSENRSARGGPKMPTARFRGATFTLLSPEAIDALRDFVDASRL